MSTLSSITVTELKYLLRSTQLPPDTKLSITFENKEAAEVVLKKKSALLAMQKLKGTGNGNLVSVLLKEREKDKSHK